MTPPGYLVAVTAADPNRTIAQDILAQVAGMRLRGEMDQSLCWSPAQLELLAMFAIAAKNKVAELRAERLTLAMLAEHQRDYLRYVDGEGYSPFNTGRALVLAMELRDRVLAERVVCRCETCCTCNAIAP